MENGQRVGRHYPPVTHVEGELDAPFGDRVTLNQRIFNTDLALKEICRELDSFLNRVHPRPPSQQPSNANKTIERVGPPPMNVVIDDLSETTHRLHALIAELSEIA